MMDFLRSKSRASALPTILFTINTVPSSAMKNQDFSNYFIKYLLITSFKIPPRNSEF